MRIAFNLGCGRDIRASTPDTRWVNADVLDLPGVDERVDLCAYPWPWADESVDHIYSRHLLEHIPHEQRSAPLRTSVDVEQWQRVQGLDGFFAFFAEAWRCLTMGGTIESEVPWPLSMETWSDPTHTRAITPQTIAYLTNPQTTREDYRLPLLFEQVGPPAFSFDQRYERAMAAGRVSAEELVALAQREWGVCHYWSFTLRKVPL